MNAAEKRRVLFLYNVDGWAIHNVGLDWAALIADTHEVTLERFGPHERLDPDAFDWIVWGYSTLRHSGRMLLESVLTRTMGWARWRRASKRWAAVVQDPSELFPQVREWKTQPADLAPLRPFARLAVTSREMQAALARLGRPATKIDTRSRLPLQEASAIVDEPLRAFTRAQRYPRKNLAWIEALAGARTPGIDRFEPILGGAVRSTEDYVRQVDGFNVYVCTSWQEGGPLPLADAMRRGCVPLTTRVGQTDEWIEHGVSGYFCDDLAAFEARLAELAGDPARRLAMRRAALARAADGHDARVAAQLREFLP